MIEDRVSFKLSACLESTFTLCTFMIRLNISRRSHLEWSLQRLIEMFVWSEELILCIAILSDGDENILTLWDKYYTIGVRTNTDFSNI